MIDSIIIGYNDIDFNDYVKKVESMGRFSGAYNDLALSFVNHNNRSYRALDILTDFYYDGRGSVERPFHTADFLWPTIIYLGTFLSRRGFTFDYVNLFKYEKDKFRQLLTKKDILTVAITTTLYVSAEPIKEIITFIKKYNDKVNIVVGGPFIANLSAMGDNNTLHHIFKDIGADFYVISQQGELAYVNIINYLKNSNPSLDSIDNIAYKKKNSTYIVTSASMETNTLHENIPDYSLFSSKAGFNEFLSIRTSTSCPFRCSFCGYPKRAGNYKYLYPEHIEKELDQIKDVRGVTTITFVDDTLNVPKKKIQRDP